jgi:hypothetical protein
VLARALFYWDAVLKLMLIFVDESKLVQTLDDVIQIKKPFIEGLFLKLN